VLSGGLVGSAARAGVALLLPTPSASFPASTTLVNVVGAFLLGFYLARRQQALGSPWSVRFWAIGVLGSFTTFSAFSIEVVELIGSHKVAMALSYVAVSVLGGIGSALVGDRLGRVLR